MSLIPSPTQINDGSADRTIAWKGQSFDPKNNKITIGEYNEPAGNLSEDLSISIKHDESKVSQRRLIQVKGNNIISGSDAYAPITVNISVVHHKDHDESSIIKYIEIGKATVDLSGFIPGFLRGTV